MGEELFKCAVGDFMEDDKIIDLYFERDENAIRETEQKYGKYCHTVAYNILHSREDAEECVSDTWHSAWNAMPPERPAVLRGFLARITRNIAIDRYRYDNAKKRGAETACAIDEYWECIPSDDGDIGDEYALRSAINGFLESLDARTRVIFMRRYWYSMSVRDIADGMGLSQSHVGVILHRTRAAFKEHLTKEGIFV